MIWMTMKSMKWMSNLPLAGFGGGQVALPSETIHQLQLHPKAIVKVAVAQFERQAVAPSHGVLLEVGLESSVQALHVPELVHRVVALVVQLVFHMPLETVPSAHHKLDLHRHGR